MRPGVFMFVKSYLYVYTHNSVYISTGSTYALINSVCLITIFILYNIVLKYVHICPLNNEYVCLITSMCFKWSVLNNVPVQTVRYA